MSGRYRIPDPTCTHARKGRVYAGNPDGAYASTQVCDRPECIADAKEWAYAMVRETPVHRPDAPAVEEPTLFPRSVALQNCVCGSRHDFRPEQPT